jgi:hydrogenase maturation protease
VIGVGTVWRADDAAGLEVVAALAELEPMRGVRVCGHEGDGAALLDLWDGAGAVVLVDSLRSGAASGTVHRIDASSTPVPVALTGASTHSFGVAEAIELARALGTLPGTLIVYGIEGGCYENETALSESVAAVIGPVAQAVRAETLGLLSGISGPVGNHQHRPPGVVNDGIRDAAEQL